MKNLFSKFKKENKTDEIFLQEIYRKLLKREIDQEGKHYYWELLKKGESRVSVILDIIESDEFKNKITRENLHHLLLPSIRTEKPHQYKQTLDINAKENIWVFKVKEPSDFDWLEKK